MPMPEDIIQTVNEMGTITNKIQLNHSDRDHYTAQQIYFGTTQDRNQDHYANTENSDHESGGHSDDQQIDGTNYNTRFPHTN